MSKKKDEDNAEGTKNENLSSNLVKRNSAYPKSLINGDEDYFEKDEFYDSDRVLDSLKERRGLQFKAKNDTSRFSSLTIRVYDVIEKLISHYSSDLFDDDEGLNAKEEDISASLSISITNSLVGEMECALHGKTIGGYKFRVKTQKKQKQEAYTGADLVGVCTIDQGSEVINKYFLLQAKIGIRRRDGTSFSKDKRIQDQAGKMLNVSPSSFFIIYTNKGFDVVSAMNVRASGKNEIDTGFNKSIPYEEFNNLLLDCFTGDNRFDKKEWKDYIKDPKNNPIPYEEALLHFIIKDKKKKEKSNK